MGNASSHVRAPYYYTHGDLREISFENSMRSPGTGSSGSGYMHSIWIPRGNCIRIDGPLHAAAMSCQLTPIRLTGVQDSDTHTKLTQQ